MGKHNMILKEIRDSDAQEFKIYVDLDGVLVNFSKFVWENVLGAASVADVETALQDKAVKRDFWKAVDKWVKSGKPFFGAMEPMEDAFELWDYVESYFPTILSATGHITTAKTEKRDWVKRHLGDTTAGMALFVRSSSDKAQYAASNHILIDDRKKSIEPWIEAGGIGILHVSAADTIEQLKELGV